jgi:hypothetical protein
VTTAAADTTQVRLAIYDCVQNYARGVDRLDRELVLSVFHDDAIVDYRTPRADFVGTPEEFVDFAFQGQDVRLTQHHLTNHTAQLDGDTAHSETYYVTVSRSEDRKRITVSGGRYVDQLERRDGEWRISARMALGEWGAEVDNAAADFLGPLLSARDRTDASYMRPLETRRP